MEAKSLEQLIEELPPEAIQSPELPAVVTGEELLSLPVPNALPLLAPIILACGLAILAGTSDIGKSMLLRQIALSICMGLPELLGFELNVRHRRVIFVTTEDDHFSTSRVLAIQFGNADPALLKNLKFVFYSDNYLLQLEDLLKENLVDLIIVDCFTDVFGGNLLDTQKLRSFLHPYYQLAIRYSCLILFAHHTSKRTEALVPSKNNMLSGQGLESKVRMVIEFRRDANDSTLRHLCIVKANYLSDTYKQESFVLKFDQQTFSFSNTGQKVHFDDLVAKPEVKVKRDLYKEAIRLRQEGKKLEEIAVALGMSGKGSVSKLLNKYHSIVAPNELENKPSSTNEEPLS